MDPTEIRQELNKRLMISKTIWVAILGSVGIYLALGYALPNMAGFKPPPSPPPEMLAHILMLVGIMNSAAGVLIALGKLPILKILPDESPGAVMQKVFSLMIISWALCESAAVMGLVIFFLYGAFNDLLMMSVIAVVGLAFGFPKEEKFTEALKKAGIMDLTKQNQLNE